MTLPPRALVLCADVALASEQARRLRQLGFEVTTTRTPQELLEARAQGPHALLVFDWEVLDGADPRTLCETLRKLESSPLVALTPGQAEGARLEAFAAGADECLARDWSEREHLARLTALLRRTLAEPPLRPLVASGLVMDVRTRSVTLHGAALQLTTYEFELLRVLLHHAGEVLSRETLMAEAKGSLDEAFDRSIDVHICRLRAKLGDSSRKPRLLRTVRGVGYQLSAG